MPRRSQADVERSRAAVTQAALQRGSIEGLEGLSLGALADEAEMRKSTVFSLFGSKEELQLATLRAAADHFRQEVWDPVADEPAGRARLLALSESWLDYHARETLPGGCFLTTATIEFDAKPGPQRDELRAITERWLGLLEREARTAIDNGELPADVDPADVAFELNALAAAASYNFHLTRNRQVFTRALRAMRRALALPAEEPR